MGLFAKRDRATVAFCTPWPMKDVRCPDGVTRRVHVPMSPLWFRARHALSTPTNFNMVELLADGMDVDEARNQAVKALLSLDPVPEFLFFIDYDVILPRDALTKLLFRARSFPQADVIAGVYCCKWQDPADPLIYTEPGAGPFWGWTMGDLLTTEQHGVTVVHNGLTLVRSTVFQRLLAEGLVHGDGTDLNDEPFYLTVDREIDIDGRKCRQQGTEDFYFFTKCRDLKDPLRILVDTSVMAGHLDKATGIAYGLPVNMGPVAAAGWLPWAGKDQPKDREKAQAEGKLLALDLGAGESRREWPGYITFTTDLRKEVLPDYVMDTRLLNFPDSHWDLVASRHHLEHLPRMSQEQVWAEMFRILRPGGKVEHVVPSLEWAAAHVHEGTAGGRVWDVLYGGVEEGEAHGLPDQYNTHLFAYTKDVARALADGAGFADVECRDWTDDEALGFELHVTARKPLPGEPAPTEPPAPTAGTGKAKKSRKRRKT